MFFSAKHSFVTQGIKKPQLPGWGLLLWSLWLAFAWQGPLWAKAAKPLAEASPTTQSVSFARDEHRFRGESGKIRPKSLPDSVFVPPDWYWTMAFVIPGLPQMLMDEPEQGLLFFIGFVSSVALVPVTVGAFTTQNQPEGANLSGANLLSWIFTAITASLYVVNVMDAYLLNQDKRKTTTAAEAAKILVQNVPELSVGVHSQGIVSLDYALSRF